MNRNGGRVIIRMDLDVDVDGDISRIELAKPTLKKALKKYSKLILIGHKGRPDGEIIKELSLKPLIPVLEKLLDQKVDFLEGDAKIILLENLRFSSGEKNNDEIFAKELATRADYFINESFGTAHREHASIVGIPKLLPSSLGMHFEKEVENIKRVLDAPRRPVISLISGLKKDKLDFLNDFIKISDKVLIGGKLPSFMDENYKNDKVEVAKLIQDKEDITINSMERFEDEIASAGTIVLSGPIGKFEDEGHRQGTSRVFTAIAKSNAYKLAGGGDTVEAIKLFELEDKFDWVSTGGGAMLHLLAHGTLPAIEAILK